MEISGKLVDELLGKGVDLENFTEGLNETLNLGGCVVMSKEVEEEYVACEKYYKEHEEIFKGVYDIDGVRYYGEELGIELSYCSFWKDFLICNGVRSINVMEMMKKLVELKDEWFEWNNIREEIYNRCVIVDNGHRFRIIHGIGLLLSGSGWEKDMKWLVKMGKKYKGGILLESIETAEDFRDLIRFRGLLGGVEGSMKALKELGDMYDILDEDDVNVLNGILKKYEDKKRAFLGNERKRKVMD